MPFTRKKLWHPYRDHSKNPLMGGGIFVFEMNLRETISQRISRLEADKEGAVMRLETEMDLNERTRLQGEIKRLDEELSDYRKMEAPERESLLLNGLGNKIDALETALAGEKNLDTRNKLEAKKARCLDVLRKRQAPITNEDAFRESLMGMENEAFVIDHLESGRFDHMDIERLLNSDLAVFFDDDFEGALQIARRQMQTNDLVTNALRPKVHEFEIEVSKEWEQKKRETEEEIAKLKDEKSKIEDRLKDDLSSDERTELKNRLWKASQMIELYEEAATPSPDDRARWMRERIQKKEMEEVNTRLMGEISPESMRKTRDMLKEAKLMRQEKIRVYLRTELEDYEKELRNKKGIFNKNTIASLEEDLNEFQRLIEGNDSMHPNDRERLLSDPKFLKQLQANIQRAKGILTVSATEVKEIHDNRGEIEREVNANLIQVKQWFDNFTPDTAERMIGEPREERQIAAIKSFSEGGEARAYISELEARLAKPEDISPEELQAIRQELKTLIAKLSAFESAQAGLDQAIDPDLNAAKNAHQSIKELEGANTLDDVERILKQNLGEKVKFLSQTEFTHYTPPGGGEPKNLQTYTTGSMAFYERGDHWEILINRDGEDIGDIRKLKAQITHELLHLEFEKGAKTANGKSVKENVQEAMLGKPEWPDIRQAFIDLGKKPPHGDTWQDDDILSELYAMQNDIGKSFITREPKDSDEKRRIHLNNLLAGMGAASMLKPEELIRGFEKGVDEDANKAKAAAKGAADTSNRTNYEEELKTLNERIESNLDSGLTDYIKGSESALKQMQEMNQKTEGLLADGNKAIFQAAIEDRIQRVKDALDKVDEALAKASAAIPNSNINPIRNIWNNTTFLSINDFGRVFVDTWDFLKRRHERKEVDHAARIGMALFQKTDLGREAKARQQGAEAGEVGEWEKRYENLDGWQVEGELKTLADGLIPNQDQLKAILRVLAKKGRLNWRNQDLWKVLNKLQSAVEFKLGDPLLLNNGPLLREKLHTALGNIYDYGEFMDLERNNESAYDSEKKKLNPAYDKIYTKLGGLLDKLLVRHQSGEKVDPAEYESILSYCIENGKSSAEQIMFHLIMGMAEGILTPDRAIALANFCNKWPAIDWFATKPQNQDYFKRLAKQYFPDDYESKSIMRDGTGRQFKNFYWKVMLNDKRVMERMNASVVNRQWDHDWGRAIAAPADSSTIKGFLQGRATQKETKDTAVENLVAGKLQWFEENAVDVDNIDWNAFAMSIGGMAMAEGILTRTAQPNSDTNAYYSDKILNSVPREGGVTNHGNWTAGQHLNHIREFMDAIDPYFFPRIRQGGVKGNEAGAKALVDELKEYLGFAYGHHQEIPQVLANINNLDSLFDSIDTIVRIIIQSKSPRQLRAAAMILQQRD